MTTLDLYGNTLTITVMAAADTPTLLHLDNWKILVNKEYKDLSEAQKEFYRAKSRWLFYNKFKNGTDASYFKEKTQ
jgi:hypothetical protein